MRKLRLPILLMSTTIVLLALFEGYWLTKLYQDEHANLKKEVDVNFRDVMYKLQRKRFETDTSLISNGFIATTNNTSLQNNKTINSKNPKKNATIVYRTFSAGDELSHVNPEMIESISVNSGYSFRGIPPPGLIEVMMKQKATGHDSGRIMIRMDSSISGEPSVKQPHNKIASSFTFRFSGKDSAAIFIQNDSLINNKLVQLLAFDSAGKKTRNWVVNKGQSQKSTPIPLLDNVVIKMQARNQEAMQSPIVRLLSGNKTINDSIPVSEVDSAFKMELKKSNKSLPFTILFNKYSTGSLRKSDFEKDSTKQFITSKVFVGYSMPYSYQANFSNANTFVIKKMSTQIGGSILLLILVIFSFVTVYRNLIAQQRLTIIKNDFISNITHELKTPIATVNVAIEALRNFGGLDNPQRTKEYLDISASELQRLSLLVDKVLKLSMFENHQIVLQKESFNLLQLIQEVMLSMKLQLEKEKAIAKVESIGENFMIDADKLHITSVIYNLLDNALKYTKENPTISVKLIRQSEYFELHVSDNGIGIPEAYKSKIFDQFFRVPSGDRHNTKGYGLGLSYVNHIIQRHDGMIEVETELGKGSTFIVKIPFAEKNSIRFKNL